MPYKLILLALSFLTINAVYAHVSPDKQLALQKLQQAINDYGDKHDNCDQKKQANTLSASTLASLRTLSEETLRKGIIRHVPF